MPQITIQKGLLSKTPPSLLEGEEGVWLSNVKITSLLQVFYNIGGPQLRTTWEIQQIAVECGLRFETSNEAEEEKNQLEIIALINNVASAVNIVQANLPKQKKPGEPGVVKFPRRIYILEPISVLFIPPGGTLDLLFKFTNEKGIIFAEPTGHRTTIFRPVLTVLVDQEFEPQRHKQLTS